MRKQKATCVESQMALEWRRRELNESCDPNESDVAQQVAIHSSAAGVPQEYLPFIVERRLTLTDARLVSVVRRWMKLSDAVRDQIEALSSHSGMVLPG